ncbi:hypothetical protein CR513_05867, partial [Mucuna pruriens]
SLSISVSLCDAKKEKPKYPILSLYLDNVIILWMKMVMLNHFSNCKILNTIYDCNVLYHNALFLRIVISTPNLSSSTFNSAPFGTLHGKKKSNVEIQFSSLI